MRTLLCFVILLLLACSACFSADVKFAWDPLTPAPSGVEIRIMDTTNTVIQTMDCGAAPTSECLVPAVTSGARQAQAFSYQVGVPTVLKEYSLGSNIVAFTVPAKPGVVPNVRVKIPQ